MRALFQQGSGQTLQISKVGGQLTGDFLYRPEIPEAVPAVQNKARGCKPKEMSPG